MRDENEREKLLAECVRYFKERPVYRKLFEKFRIKYGSLGHLGGKVVLTGLSGEEKMQLGGFLQKDYAENRTITVSAELLEKALRSSRFSELSWEMIFEKYYGKPLEVKKDLQKQQEEQRAAYFQGLLDKCENEKVRSWLEAVLAERGNGYLFLMQKYQERPAVLRNMFEKVDRAVSLLPMFSSEKELLAVFAAFVSGNPHEFDEGTDAEKLLSTFLKWYLKPEEIEGLSGAEYKNRLYYEAGILKDPLSNDVLVYGIRAWKMNGELHAGVEGFFGIRNR